MLNIQEEIIASSLETIVEKYSLNCKDAGHKVLLKYDQIESFSFKGVESVKECRGIILEKGSWKVMSWPFKRFFNQGEFYADSIDLNTARVYKKEDGSLTALYWDYVIEEWCVQTSGTPDGDTPVGNFAMTFRELFDSTIGMSYENFNKDFCYIFELCTPYNIVVTPHAESYVRVLSIRNMVTLKELSHEEVTSECARLGLTQVESYTFAVTDVAAMAAELPQTEEGYIVCDANFNRVKVKNPAYVALHHLKGKLCRKELFTIIKKGEQDEFLALMPEYTDMLNARDAFYVELYSEMKKFIYTDLIPYKIETKKEFASWLFKSLNNYKYMKFFSGLFFKYADIELILKEYEDGDWFRCDLRKYIMDILKETDIIYLEKIFNS